MICELYFLHNPRDKRMKEIIRTQNLPRVVNHDSNLNIEFFMFRVFELI